MSHDSASLAWLNTYCKLQSTVLGREMGQDILYASTQSRCWLAWWLRGLQWHLDNLDYLNWHSEEFAGCLWRLGWHGGLVDWRSQQLHRWVLRGVTKIVIHLWFGILLLRLEGNALWAMRWWQTGTSHGMLDMEGPLGEVLHELQMAGHCHHIHEHGCHHDLQRYCWPLHLVWSQ